MQGTVNTQKVVMVMIILKLRSAFFRFVMQRVVVNPN